MNRVRLRNPEKLKSLQSSREPRCRIARRRSIRLTNSPTGKPTWLRDAFGIGPLGMPYGGVRRGKGGFQIPLGPLGGCPDHRALWQVCKQMVEETIRRRIGTPREDDDEARPHGVDA